MNKLIAAVAALLISSVAFAQVGTAVKEGAKATSETAKQGGQNVAGAVTGEPEKTVHKTKAAVHKAKARAHAHAAKAAVKEIGK